MFPADMKCVDWLSWFVADSEGDTGKWFLLPSGERAATDGKLAVVTNEPTESEPGVSEKLAKRGVVIANILAQLSTHSITLPYPDAVAMFGECQHIFASQCPACKGTGNVPHYCGCDLCEADEEECGCDNGIAMEYPPDRYCAIWNHPFDANLIAYIFAHSPACETCRIEYLPHDDKQAGILRVITERWKALLVGLKEDTLGEHDCQEVMKETAST